MTRLNATFMQLINLPGKVSFYFFWLFLTSVGYGQIISLDKEIIEDELAGVKSDVDNCYNNLMTIERSVDSLKLNAAALMEMFIEDEIRKKKMAVADFNSCINESRLRLDSLKNELIALMNPDSLTANLEADAAALLKNEISSYEEEINQLNLQVAEFEQKKAKAEASIIKAEKDMNNEVKNIKQKAAAELKKAERELKKAQKKAEAELKKLGKNLVPKIK